MERKEKSHSRREEALTALDDWQPNGGEESPELMTRLMKRKEQRSRGLARRLMDCYRGNPKDGTPC